MYVCSYVCMHVYICNIKKREVVKFVVRLGSVLI